MARQTNKVAPKMHYYIVEWEGSLHPRNCSEYLYDDEVEVALMHKDEFNEAVDFARSLGVDLLHDRQTFETFMKKYSTPKGWSW